MSTRTVAQAGLVAAVVLLLTVAPELARADDAEAALRELRGLRSVTRAGLNYAEYQRRVLDAKVVVDRYLAAGDPGRPDRWSAISSALGLYIAAARAWNNSIMLAGATGPVGKLDLGRVDCNAARPYIDRIRAVNADFTEQRISGRLAAIHAEAAYKLLFPELWSCASERIAQAEAAPPIPKAPVSAEEADRQLKGVLERSGESAAKCEKKQYGAGWVTICE